MKADDSRKAKAPKEKNKMREVRVEKVVLNIGCGGKTKVDTAKTLMERLTKAKIVITISKRRTTFGGAPGKGKPIGVKVTIRPVGGAEALIKRLLEARNKKLTPDNFDETGNVNFGVKEYIDIPGVEYDPKMPMIGMNVCIALERRGYRVKRKSVAAKVGRAHLVDPEAAMRFMEDNFDVKIEEKGSTM
jgi:large subunit ribosomal protein L5